MADSLVLQVITTHNRPFNTQLVADLLATKGVKKPAAQRSLDSLAAAGKIRVREFGKTKIYYPNRDADVLGKEELQAKRAATAELSTEIADARQALTSAKRDLAALQKALTLEQLEAAVKKASTQVTQLEEHVAPLRTGKVTISAADNEALERVLSDYLAAWQRRKRMFNDVWDTMADGVGRKEKDVFEEVGVDTDEAMKVSLREMNQLLPKRRR